MVPSSHGPRACRAPLTSAVVSRFGRRTIYLYGLAGMGATMLITGILGFVNANGARWALGTMLILLNLFYNMSVGPACYVIISETHSTRLRAKVSASRTARIEHHFITPMGHPLSHLSYRVCWHTRLELRCVTRLPLGRDTAANPSGFVCCAGIQSCRAVRCMS
jgi:hypothetical protein